MRGIGRMLIAVGMIAAATVAGSTQASASPHGGVFASCSSSSNLTEKFWMNMSWSSFAAKDEEYFADGLRITQLDIEGNDVTAAWHPGSGTQRVHWNMSLDRFKALDTQYFAQGLRLVDVDNDGGDWAAVWRPGSAAQHWRSGIPSWTDFKNQDQVYFDQGLRLVDVIITADDNITGVWRGDQGTGGQLWSSGVMGTGVDENNDSAFDRLNRAHKQAGYELRILKTHPHDDYIMAVWRYRGGSFSQSTELYLPNATAVANMRAYCLEHGMRLVAVDAR
ncbi:hypothetical protein AB0K14_20010 [Actinosynnema sp. NPDC050801]|uniref:hypothetical protein n=1 Tax=unclassified Actinosynnema TaxID=2637065 RepID=UPI0033E5AF98